MKFFPQKYSEAASFSSRESLTRGMPEFLLSRVKAEGIERAFVDVKAQYFPRWDRAGLWRVRFHAEGMPTGDTGYCDTKAKTIHLDRQVLGMTDAGVLAILIHEICHDVGGAGHGRRWATRMEKAAQLAMRTGHEEVAEILRANIFSYLGNGAIEECSRSNVYSLAAEIVDKVVDVESMIRRVAKYFGLAPSKIRRDFGLMLKEEFYAECEQD